MKKFVSPYGATSRRNFVLALLAIYALIVLCRVVYLQVYHAEFLVGEGNNRFIRTITEPALRGLIKDRNGELLAVSTPVSTVWVNPKEIVDDLQSIKSLSESLGLDYGRLAGNIRNKADKSFMYIQRGLPPSVVDAIMAKKLPGVYDLREYRRYYPGADVMSQVIGFNDIDDHGQEGVELLYDEWLSGQAGSAEVIRDRAGKVVDVLQEISPPVQGQDLILTIDKRIQFLTYQALLEAIDEFDAKAATAVVLDAESFEILAMVSVPSGNPNNALEKKPSLVKNRAITDTYEPGSVIKPISVAAALESGVVNPNTKFETSPGQFRVGKYTVKDVHNYGELDVSGVIKKSSNVGTAKIALKTSRERMRDLFQAVGFGQVSDVGFPGEQAGVLRDFSKLGDFEYVTNTYGYGMSATTLQLAQAYAVIANDGVKRPVSLVKREVMPQGKQLLSKRVAEQVREMIAAAVAQGGTGTRAVLGEYMQDYSVGGKTGTVHKVIDGQYAEKVYRSTFVGMSPVTDPKIVMAIMVDEPQGKAYYGGLVAAPVFAKVVGKSLRIMDVPPDKVDYSDEGKILQVSSRVSDD